MASIRKRGQRYEVRICRKDHPTKCKSFLTLKDAQLWAKRIEVAIERGEAVGTQRAVLGELIERYRLTVTPSKKGSYAENLRLLKWAKHPFGDRDAHSIKPTEIAEWRDARLKLVANNTVRLELAALSVVFQEAKKEWGFSTLTNPVHLIRRPSPGKGRDRRLEGDELVRVISHSESPMLGEIMALAIETSMRLSEIVSLRWESIDLNRSIAKLPDTKNGDVRFVPLSSTALHLLRSMNVAKEGLVFPIKSHGVTVAFRRAVARAKIDNLHFHDLRHEGTSRLFEKGLHVMEVGSITGHKTLSMLQRYTHLRPESLLAKLG
jgi:integrase